MQPRILVKEQGQQKKRFVSPIQVKTNQLLYGESLGPSKFTANSPPNLNRLYSPQYQQQQQMPINFDNRQRGKQVSQKVAEQQIRKITQRRNIGSSGLNQEENKQIQNRFNKNEIRPNNQRLQKNDPSHNGSKLNTSKSKQKQKDYMMVNLAKFNKKSLHSNKGEQNSSESIKQGSSFAGQSQKGGQTQNQQQYKKNIYNKNQKEKSKEANKRQKSGSRLSERSQSNSKVRKNKLSEVRKHPMNNYQKVTQSTSPNQKEVAQQSEAKRQEQKNASLGFQSKDYSVLSKRNDTIKNTSQEELKLTKQKSQRNNQVISVSNLRNISRNNIQKHQELPRHTNKQDAPNQFYSKEQNNVAQITEYQTQDGRNKFFKTKQDRKQDRKSQIPDPNSSTLITHLKKTLQEKQQLIQHKNVAQKEINDLKAKCQSFQLTNSEMRKQIQQLQVQKLVQSSELTYLKEIQGKTKNQLNHSNEKTEHIFREIHEKYQLLLKRYKQLLQQNNSLRHQLETCRVQSLNWQHKCNFNETRIAQSEQRYYELQEQYKTAIKQTVEEWKGKLQHSQSELRDYINQNQMGFGSGGANIGNMKIKMIELQTQLTHKKDLLSRKDGQINDIRKQGYDRVKYLQQNVYKKQKQLKQNSQQISKIQNECFQKLKQSEAVIKQIQLKLNRAQKELNLKSLQLESYKNSIGNSTQLNLVTSAYPVDAKYVKETEQVKQTIQGFVNNQTKQVNWYKQQMGTSFEETYQLKAQIEEKRAQINNLQQQLKILQMQYKSLEKKAVGSSQLMLVKNELQVALKKGRQLQQQIQWKSNQIRQKDKFIQTQLLGVTKQQNVPKLLDMLKGIHQRMHRQNS